MADRDEPAPDGSPSREHLAMVAVFVACAILRATGIDWGLPYQFHPDESSPVYQAIYVGQGQLNPGNFYKPTLWPYLLFPLYGAYYLLGHAAGSFPTLAHFQYHYIVNTHHFWLIARAANVILSALTVFLVYRAGKAADRRWAGVLGAAILAVSARHVSQSHIATADTLMTFLAAASLLFTIGMITKGRKRDALLAGLFLGLACAAKYNAILFVPCIALAHAIRVKREEKPLWKIFAGRGWIAAGAAAAGFLVACPWPILDPTTFFSTAFANIGFASAGWWGSSGDVNGVRAYLVGTLARAEGWPVVIAWIAGLIAVVRRRRGEETLIAAWGTLYFACVSMMTLVGHRYLMPALPAIFLTCAFFGVDLVRAILRRLRPARLAQALAGAVILALLVPSLLSATAFVRVCLAKDFRVTAAEDLTKVFPPGARILSDYACFAPPLQDMPPDPADVESGIDDQSPGPNSSEAQLDHWLAERAERGLGDLASLKLPRPNYPPRYRIKYIDYPWGGADRTARIRDLDFYREGGFRYVILADALMKAALARKDTPPYDRYARFHEELSLYARKVATFNNPHAQTVHKLGLEIPTRIDVYSLDEGDAP